MSLRKWLTRQQSRRRKGTPRQRRLTWSILRFGFVYGEKDGHLESLPKLVGVFKLHPAAKLSLIHHQDIAAFIDLALTGALDGQTVNTVDDAPTSIYELCDLVGEPIAPSSEPLANPWWGHVGRLTIPPTRLSARHPHHLPSRTAGPAVTSQSIPGQ